MILNANEVEQYLIKQKDMGIIDTCTTLNSLFLTALSIYLILFTDSLRLVMTGTFIALYTALDTSLTNGMFKSCPDGKFNNRLDVMFLRSHVGANALYTLALFSIVLFQDTHIWLRFTIIFCIPWLIRVIRLYVHIGHVIRSTPDRSKEEFH